MKVAIIKYNAGNIMSVDFALQRLGIKAKVTADVNEIKSADRVIFPGVGEASTTMSFLREKKMDKLIYDLRQPVLGICLGLQLMCSHSEEGDVECLGIFPEKVKKFVPEQGLDHKNKVPHMGWNSISGLRSNIFDETLENQYFYFVHSFYTETGPDTVASCQYMVPFSAALQKANFYATQFHPEKSGQAGERILHNFINLNI
jgi:imidazole glycerol-phosphate synthase subunit HisH